MTQDPREKRWFQTLGFQFSEALWLYLCVFKTFEGHRHSTNRLFCINVLDSSDAEAMLSTFVSPMRAVFARLRLRLRDNETMPQEAYAHLPWLLWDDAFMADLRQNLGQLAWFFEESGRVDNLAFEVVEKPQQNMVCMVVNSLKYEMRYSSAYCYEDLPVQSPSKKGYDMRGGASTSDSSSGASSSDQKATTAAILCQKYVEQDRIPESMGNKKKKYTEKVATHSSQQGKKKHDSSKSKKPPPFKSLRPGYFAWYAGKKSL